MRPLSTPSLVAAVLRRGAGRRRPRPSSLSAPYQQDQGQERRLSPSPQLLLPRRLASGTPGSSGSSSGSGNGNSGDKADEEQKEEKEGSNPNETAHFNVVAAEARGDPSRRFTVSTDGQRRQKGARWTGSDQ